jgi:hypothetical protein
MIKSFIAIIGVVVCAGAAAAQPAALTIRDRLRARGFSQIS